MVWYLVGARVTLNGATGLVLVNNVTNSTVANDPTETTPINTDGDYVFATTLTGGANYAVSVATQPSGFTCTVSNESGTISYANVTNVSVTCAAIPVYSVRATVALNGATGLVLVNNVTSPTVTNDATATTPITTSGNYLFATSIPSGASYVVTIATQPAGYTCTVTNASGTIAESNVTNVSVSCTALPTYTVRATVALNGATGLVLKNNVTSPTVTNDPTVTTPITSSGNYLFTTSIPTGAHYTVSIATQPTSYSCTLGNATGTIAGANVTNVSVSCTFVCTCPATYTADSSNLFCSKMDATATPGSFLPIQVGDTNGAYGPSGPWAFSFSQSSNYPYKDTNGTLADSTNASITRITPLAGGFWNGRMNAISIKPNPAVVNDFYELSFCLTAPTTREYVFGIAADNGMGFSVGGKRLFESSLVGGAQGSTFAYWWLGSITLTAGTYPVNFLWNDQGGAAALGYEFYQNTMTEVVAATALSQLTVLDRSSNHIGETQYAKQGSTCVVGSSYNACTNLCETKSVVSCQ